MQLFLSHLAETKLLTTELKTQILLQLKPSGQEAFNIAFIRNGQPMQFKVQCFRQVLRGSKRKRSRQGCYLLAHKPEVLEELVAQIASGTFRVKDYREPVSYTHLCGR